MNLKRHAKAFGKEMLRFWRDESGKGTSSTTDTDKSTKITTTTTTNIRDIGLTGAHAVELAAVLSEGIRLQTEAVGTSFLPVVNAIAEQGKLIAASGEKSPAQITAAKSGSMIDNKTLLLIGAFLSGFFLITKAVK